MTGIQKKFRHVAKIWRFRIRSRNWWVYASPTADLTRPYCIATYTMAIHFLPINCRLLWRSYKRAFDLFQKKSSSFWSGDTFYDDFINRDELLSSLTEMGLKKKARQALKVNLALKGTTTLEELRKISNCPIIKLRKINKINTSKKMAISHFSL